jgi:two-component system nitrogen regulation sensor histidine kinase NtrY
VESPGNAREHAVIAQAGRRAAAVVLLISAASSLFFLAYALRLSSLVSAGLTAHREIEAELRQSLADQRQLAHLDPHSAPEYHRRFDATATLLRRLRVVEINREALTRHIEELIVAAVALLLASALALYLFERRGREQRLVRVESAVAALSRGEAVAELDDRRRDAIGRIASAVVRSSRIATADRQRIRYLEHLSAWQEAARRHAHEIRTPLTAIRMEVDRLTSALQTEDSDNRAEVESARASILSEIRQLTEFTRNFTSFAAIPAPKMQRLDLSRLIAEFAVTFGNAWPNLRLHVGHAESGAFVNADADMIRRVLVNLAANSSQAANGRGGTVTFEVRHEQNSRSIYVSDDGPGLPSGIRSRLFEPYTTSRGIGQGMGLGLAISKKILLDHGGDLHLIDPTSGGTTFRLSLPEAS